jgi:ribosome-binding protein aMBF1 (putative translation factor)
MDLEQREQFRDIVVAAMEAKAWSAATLHKKSGVSTTTITKVTLRAGNVTPGTVGKLRKALDIEALAPGQAREGYTRDVEMIREAVGIWLRDVPWEQRGRKVAHLFAAMEDDARD